MIEIYSPESVAGTAESTNRRKLPIRVLNMCRLSKVRSADITDLFSNI
jgi:hypothetical protein